MGSVSSRRPGRPTTAGGTAALLCGIESKALWFSSAMSKLFALIALVAGVAGANELSYKSLQSYGSTTPLYDHGIHGEGQIVAFLDTGVDYQSCFFVEPDGSRPPINTRLDGNNVDLTRRKIVAYNFLYSCDQFPNAAGCDDPNS